MGKRSTFERRPRDTYDTPAEAVVPLLAFLPPETRFAEPCAGRGDLVTHLEAAGHLCVDASDIEPRATSVRRCDAMEFLCPDAAVYISNPPWSRTVLHPMIEHLARHRPTWLLLDANWLFTQQAKQFLPMCRAVVTIGRVKWIPDSSMTGKDDAAWLLFDAHGLCSTQFVGRRA